MPNEIFSPEVLELKKETAEKLVDKFFIPALRYLLIKHLQNMPPSPEQAKTQINKLLTEISRSLNLREKVKVE